jgi:hypothetical protein
VVEYVVHRYGGHQIKWATAPLKAFHKYHAVVGLYTIIFAIKPIPTGTHGAQRRRPHTRIHH